MTPQSGGVLAATTLGTFDLGASLAGQSYYVDNAGLDTNDGLSPATAWQTVGHVNRQIFNPGDQILFQGGQSFTDTDLEVYSNGTASLPVTFSSYGTGQATFNQVFFSGYSYLTFQNIAVVYAAGLPFNGNGNNITVDSCLIDGQSAQTGSVQLGLSAKGNNWTVSNCTIQNTGLSGLQWYGDTLTATGNIVTNIGLRSPGSASPAVAYNAHGMYLGQTGFPGINATIDSNTIYQSPGLEACMSSGVSQRSHHATITNNTIHHCQIAIDFYESDAVAGLSTWSSNQISRTTVAPMYVQGPTGGDFPTAESFTIQFNQFGPFPVGSQAINVQSSYTTGVVTINQNTWGAFVGAAAAGSASATAASVGVLPAGVPMFGMLGTAELSAFEFASSSAAPGPAPALTAAAAAVSAASAAIRPSAGFTASTGSVSATTGLVGTPIARPLLVMAAGAKSSATATVKATGGIVAPVETLPSHATITLQTSTATITYASHASIAPYSSTGAVEISNDPLVFA